MKDALVDLKDSFVELFTDEPAFRWLIIGLVLLIALMVYLAIEDAKEWEQFRKEHNCKIVGKQSGDTSLVVLPNGQGGTSIGVSQSSGKTGWLCDDGITYWR